MRRRRPRAPEAISGPWISGPAVAGTEVVDLDRRRWLRDRFGLSPGSEILLVGQSCAQGQDPRSPLSPYGGANQTGPRLCAMLGMPETTYLVAFDRANVINRWPGRATRGEGPRFPVSEARDGWRALTRLLWHRHVVLFGQPIARIAFDGGEPPELFTWTPLEVAPGRTVHVAVCPHPSTRNRWWLDAANRAAGEAFVRELGSSVGFGTDSASRTRVTRVRAPAHAREECPD